MKYLFGLVKNDGDTMDGENFFASTTCGRTMNSLVTLSTTIMDIDLWHRVRLE